MNNKPPKVAYVADFETISDTPNHARVWATGFYNIFEDDFCCLSSIDSCMRFMQEHPATYYFHNLKFDGNFIIAWLMRHGYTHTFERKLKTKEFSTIISDKNQFYKISICMGYRCKIEILDSLKLLTMSVAKIAKAFGMDEGKGEIDYTAPRPVGYQPTREEIDYIRRDCKIVARGLKFYFDNGLYKMTQGSNAYSFLKDEFAGRFPGLLSQTTL